MKRLLIALGVVLAVVGGIVTIMDGLSIRRELEYRDPQFAPGAPLSVNIQNIQRAAWGGALLESSTYGPPFDLYVFGTLPQDTPVTSVDLTSLAVTAPDGSSLLSVSAVSLPLADGQTLQAGIVTANKTYSYEAHAFTSATPPSLSVALELLLTSATGSQPLTVRKHFQLHRIRRLSLGSHDWHF